MGTKFLGTICPWGQEVGDQKSGDQMGLGHEFQLKSDPRLFLTLKLQTRTCKPPGLVVLDWALTKGLNLYLSYPLVIMSGIFWCVRYWLNSFIVPRGPQWTSSGVPVGFDLAVGVFDLVVSYFTSLWLEIPYVMLVIYRPWAFWKTTSISCFVPWMVVVPLYDRYVLSTPPDENMIGSLWVLSIGAVVNWRNSVLRWERSTEGGRCRSSGPSPGRCSDVGSSSYLRNRQFKMFRRDVTQLYFEFVMFL